MRLFAAVELGDDARAAIAAEQQRIGTALGAVARSLRFVRAAHMHLTLVFIGEIAEVGAGPIVEVMGGDITQAPFQLVFGGVGNLWGTLVGGMSMGVVNQLLEPYAGAVLAKIFVLVALILFIQRWPRGLFPQTGRAAESQ